MSKISSTLELIDNTTKTIQTSIKSINKVTKAMSLANKSAAEVDIGTPLLKGAAAADRTSRRIKSLESGIKKLKNADVNKIPKEISKIGQSAEKSEEGISKLQNKLQNLNSGGFGSLNGIRSGFGLFSKAIMVANQGLQLIKSSFEALSGAAATVDTRMMTDARLSFILDSSHTQEQLENQIMSAANNAGAQYGTTADLVAKIGRQDYFKGNNNMAARFADIVNKGFAVSGASASETDGAIRQLTQGLASGNLRGDEFNSVMENAPILSEMIADSLNVTKGELREIASTGALSADVVAQAILESGQKVDNMFNQMPVTFERSANVIKNHISNIANVLSEPDMAFGRLNQKLQNFIKWLDTAERIEFQANIVSAVNAIINALIWVLDLVGEIYNFVVNNWSWIAPVIIGITTAVILLNISYTLLTIILGAVAFAEGIKQTAQNASTAATIAQTTAQYGLNVAMYACPVTWIIGVIMLIITAILAVTAVIYYLWQTNIDFRIGVVQIWNNVLGFFDKIPLGFSLFGNAVLDVFNGIKNGILQAAQNMCNGVIYYINTLIESLNTIPGVEIKAIETVQFATESKLKDEAKREMRLQKYNAEVEAISDKSTARAEKLESDKIKWAAEIEQNKAFLDKIKNISDFNFADAFTNDNPLDTYVTGGGLDKEIDISSSSLEYLNDIAERQALMQFDALNSQMELVTEDAKMADDDKKLIMETAGSKQIVYYLSYTGGISMNNSINKGKDWEAIKHQLIQETQSEIDIGISDLEEVILS